MNSIYYVCQNIFDGSYCIKVNTCDTSYYRIIEWFDTYEEANYYAHAFLKQNN